MDKRADFNHVPEFLHLHDLALELLREHHLKPHEFSLELDGKVMENQNTRQILKALHADGSRTACIFLKLQAADVPEFPCAHGQPSCPEKLLVCIDGSIGSRKSELMQKLLDINAQRAQQKVTVVREPLNQLSAKMIDFYRALDAGTDVTEEQRDQSSRFEEDMFDHHFNVATNTEIRTRHVIAERSMEAKIHVFNELNFLQGRLSEKSRDDMRRQFEKEVLGNPQHEPHAIIFCDISVKQAMERIKRRGREGEEKITTEYLEDIQQKYAELYPPEAPNVVRVESDHPMEDNIVAIQNQLPDILKKSSKLSDAEIEDFMQFFSDVRDEPD
jgi:deoxyadenosine/deoxycytidine kinase